MKKIRYVLLGVIFGVLLCSSPVVLYTLQKDNITPEPSPEFDTDAHCPDFEEPAEYFDVDHSTIITLLYEFQYDQEPSVCFDPHPSDGDWYAAGWAIITIGDDDPVEGVNTWFVYDPISLREWDGETILVGDVIDLERMNPEFKALWKEFNCDLHELRFEIHIEDIMGHMWSERFTIGCDPPETREL